MKASQCDRRTAGRVVVGLGELLWDLLPEGPRLGGAPANFAVMAGRLGCRAVIASRVGADALGVQAREKLAALPVDASLIQSDEELPTGTVTVAMEGGEPKYTIHEPAAWDRLELTPEWRALAEMADAVCFGTLAQRETRSRETILAFLDATGPECLRVLDVNLRAPFWHASTLRGGLARATVVKLNAAELPEVLRASGAWPHAAQTSDEDELLQQARRLLEHCPARLVCVTMGAAGSLLATRTGRHRHPGREVPVRDTVGAGDAFTAALAYAFLASGGTSFEAALERMNEAGNRWGAWVASQAGAMPEVDEEMRAEIEGLGTTGVP